MRPKQIWLIVVLVPLIVMSTIGRIIVLPLDRTILQYIAAGLTTATLVLAYSVHEITRGYVRQNGVHREANALVRVSMKRGMFDGLFVFDALALVGLGSFIILDASGLWLNFWVFMMLGAVIVLSLNLANDYGVLKRELAGSPRIA